MKIKYFKMAAAICLIITAHALCHAQAAPNEVKINVKIEGSSAPLLGAIDPIAFNEEYRQYLINIQNLGFKSPKEKLALKWIKNKATALLNAQGKTPTRFECSQESTKIKSTTLTTFKCTVYINP